MYIYVCVCVYIYSSWVFHLTFMFLRVMHVDVV